MKISPKNVTAQLYYRARGNPPGTAPDSSVGNYYPGLELDFRNVWRKIFDGIELHEAAGYVVRVDDSAPPEVKQLLGRNLTAVDGRPIWVEVKGPTTPGGPVVVLDHWFLEWSNALADLPAKAGSRARCTFSADNAQDVTVELAIRPMFARAPGTQNLQPLISEDLAAPGELTQSLCSPWQNDFIGCGCYYWAASRPDFVNVETDAAGNTTGQNWLQKNRTPATPREYTLRESDLLNHEDIIESWEDKLKFVVGGNDER